MLLETKFCQRYTSSYLNKSSSAKGNCGCDVPLHCAKSLQGRALSSSAKKKFSIYANSAKVSCFVPSHPICHPTCRGQLVAIGAGLGQLIHMVHQCIQAYIWHLRQGVPLILSHPSLPCPVWANWWLLVLAWDNWSAWSINVYKHIYGISGKVSHLSSPIPSCPVLYGPIGGYWCWPETIGPYGPSMYTSIYMASQARCPTCPAHPSLPHPIPSHPISATAWGTDLIQGSLERSLSPHFKFWKMESPWQPA